MESVEGSGRSVDVQSLHSVSRVRRLALGFVHNAVLRSDEFRHSGREVVFRHELKLLELKRQWKARNLEVIFK